jgi:hypothetical protein
MKSKLIFTSLLATALISPGRANATCFIQEARLQQISEREILAIIDGYCTREYGETGYYTQIGPDTYGEVMAVYGNRNIDQYWRGFESRYGFNIVFSDSKDSYEAGVWIGDADGVVHSEVMTIANQYATTTTSSSTTTTPSSPSTTATQAPQVLPPPTTAQETIENTTSPQITEIVQTTTTTSTTIVVSIQKQVTPKKGKPKCLSRQKSCKLRAVGVKKTIGQK